MSFDGSFNLPYDEFADLPNGEGMLYGIDFMKQQGMVEQDLPSSGLRNQAGMAQPGMPFRPFFNEQNMAQQGMFTNGSFFPRGMAQQGMAQQGMPHQGMPHQGMCSRPFFNQQGMAQQNMFFNGSAPQHSMPQRGMPHLPMSSTGPVSNHSSPAGGPANAPAPPSGSQPKGVSPGEASRKKQRLASGGSAYRSQPSPAGSHMQQSSVPTTTVRPSDLIRPDTRKRSFSTFEEDDSHVDDGNSSQVGMGAPEGGPTGLLAMIAGRNRQQAADIAAAAQAEAATAAAAPAVIDPQLDPDMAIDGAEEVQGPLNPPVVGGGGDNSLNSGDASGPADGFEVPTSLQDEFWKFEFEQTLKNLTDADIDNFLANPTGPLNIQGDNTTGTPVADAGPSEFNWDDFIKEDWNNTPDLSLSGGVSPSVCLPADVSAAPPAAADPAAPAPAAASDAAAASGVAAGSVAAPVAGAAAGPAAPVPGEIKLEADMMRLAAWMYGPNSPRAGPPCPHASVVQPAPAVPDPVAPAADVDPATELVDFDTAFASELAAQGLVGLPPTPDVLVPVAPDPVAPAADDDLSWLQDHSVLSGLAAQADPGLPLAPSVPDSAASHPAASDPVAPAGDVDPLSLVNDFDLARLWELRAQGYPDLSPAPAVPFPEAYNPVAPADPPLPAPVVLPAQVIPPVAPAPAPAPAPAADQPPEGTHVVSALQLAVVMDKVTRLHYSSPKWRDVSPETLQLLVSQVAVLYNGTKTLDKRSQLPPPALQGPHLVCVAVSQVRFLEGQVANIRTLYGPGRPDLGGRRASDLDEHLGIISAAIADMMAGKQPELAPSAPTGPAPYSQAAAHRLGRPARSQQR